MRRTKIIATIGPASAEPATLDQLLLAGVDVVRINLSHGSADDHRRYVAAVRAAAERCGRPFTAVLFDTQGPEVRVGTMPEGGLDLPTGARLRLVGTHDAGARAVLDGPEPVVPVNFAGLAEALEPGDRVLLDDGNIILLVEDVAGGGAACRVEAGGTLLTRKKVTFPRPPANLPALTPEDLEGLRLAVELDVDFVAASFVRTADDVLEVRRAIESEGGRQAVIAKIENAAGVEHLDEILEVADGLMVARGDLGVEMPAEEVPILQKRLIAACNRRGKPAITATQMLESMVSRPRPTRAEASDVANAIFDGTDAVMLSAETATGRYPVEAVRVMARIAERADRALAEGAGRRPVETTAAATVTDAISHASCSVARDLGAAAIVTATQSGHTARMVARHRPPMAVVAATPSQEVARRLSLVWGVTPVIVPQTGTSDQMMEASLAAAVEAGLVQPGALVVLTAGVPVGVAGTTNLVQVTTVASILADGMGIGRGSRVGFARIAASGRPPRFFAPGDVLVVPSVTPDLMDLVAKAGALVAEAPGMTSDAAVAALHYKIPAVVGVEQATQRIRDGELVTVDAGIGRVYRGRVSVR